MSEPTSRLNLIQRAMQHAAFRRSQDVRAEEPCEADNTNGRPDVAPALSATTNGATAAVLTVSPQSRSTQDVRLNYAMLRESRIVLPDDKRSATYNEFRSIKRKLLPMARDKAGSALMQNLIMVTSALPAEGKTFTAMNLAIGMAAESNLDVVLVDVDVTRATIRQYFMGGHDRGLLELLTDERCHVDDVLYRCSDLPNLHVMFAGNQNDAAPELLASKRMGDVCAELSKRFSPSIVIFDAPPVLVASEPVALLTHIHHLIMVVSAGVAGRHQVEEALNELSSCPSISLLFNKAPEWQRAAPQSYYYYYGNSGVAPP